MPEIVQENRDRPKTTDTMVDIIASRVKEVTIFIAYLDSPVQNRLELWGRYYNGDYKVLLRRPGGSSRILEDINTGYRIDFQAGEPGKEVVVVLEKGFYFGLTVVELNTGDAFVCLGGNITHLDPGGVLFI